MTENDPQDPRADREADAAAAEAGSIGGRRDPDVDPVEEAGGGEAEGFEQAEEDLVEHAAHGDPAPDPGTQAFTPEAESDRETAERGEADEVVQEDRPDAAPDES